MRSFSISIQSSRMQIEVKIRGIATADVRPLDNDKRRRVVFGFTASESSVKFLDVRKHPFNLRGRLFASDI